MDGVHIGIFLREPRPGRVKTRLARTIGGEAAASFYTAMLVDTVTLARRCGAASCLFFHEGAPPASFLGESAEESDLSIEQRGEDLGARLDAAMGDAARAGRLPMLFLGSDSPDLPVALAREAVEALPGTDVVLGPSSDGGAWCIGLRAPVGGFFDGLPWSQPETLEALGRRATELGLRTLRVREWSDVDEWPDLLALAERLRQNPQGAPHCHEWLMNNLDRLKDTKAHF